MDFYEVGQVIIRTQDKIDFILTELARVESKPMVNATIYMKPDRNGRKTIMQLIHKRKDNRHEYVGKDMIKQCEAEDKVKNFKYHKSLENELIRYKEIFEELLQVVRKLDINL